MLHTLSRETPSHQTPSHQLPEQLSQTLSKSAQKIYAVLRSAALEVASRRGYSPKVPQVTFHVPAEIVAFAVGIHRATLYRHLPQLQEQGLVAYRAHKTTHKDKIINDGTLWSIKLNLDKSKPAYLTYEELKHSWRDLSADIESGRTAWNQLRQSKPLDGVKDRVDILLDWALYQQSNPTPLTMTVAKGSESGPEAVLDVPYATKEDRGKMVDAAAHAVATYLGDTSINFYRWLLWQLLRLEDRGQSYWEPLYLMIRRAGADKQEGFARKPGALLVARLKQGGLWDLLKATPPHKVGPKPIKA